MGMVDVLDGFGYGRFHINVSHCTPELKPIWWRLWLGAFCPQNSSKKSRLSRRPSLTKDMKSPRPKRLRRDRVPWEAVVASTLDAAKKAE
jgi:hypothetical protein